MADTTTNAGPIVSNTSTVAGLPRSVIDAALANVDNKVISLVGSNAQASWYDYGGTVARTLIGMAAGYGYSGAKGVTGDEATFIGSIVAGVLILIWGAVKNKLAAIRTNRAVKASAAASAVATATTGMATAVALEPPPNKV